MTHPPIRTAGRLAVTVLLGAGLVLAGCGDDDDDEDTAPTTEDTAAAEETETTETTSPIDDVSDGGVEDGVVEITLVDFAFEGVPESVPAGTRLTIVNDSAEELHELIALRLPDDEDRPIEEIAALPEAEVEALFPPGPPSLVLIAPPGGEQIDAVGDGTLTEPGRYALVCFIPTGVDPEEYLAAAEASEEGPPEQPGQGPPHFAHGMVADLIVE
jgi:hypothetical protein